jgi:2-polyprenyl-3-methyl-5-hydroxy-6-metoxy-1,4-benzoquinol methylase
MVSLVKLFHLKKSSKYATWETIMEYVKCNYCECDDPEMLYKTKDNFYGLGKDFSIVKCKNCGLVFLNPRPGSTEISHYYPQNLYYSQFPHTDLLKHKIKYLIYGSLRGYCRYTNSAVKYFTGKLLALIFSGIMEILIPFRKNGKILDIGCGNGGMIGWMGKYGWETYGTDLNAVSCEQAMKLGIRVFCGAMEDAKYESGFFDVVTMCHVFEHVPNPGRLLKEIHRVLRKNGLLIITVPNFNCYDSRTFLENWIDLDSPRHFYHYTKENLNKYLDSAGFAIDKWKYQFPIRLISTLNHRLSL